MASVSAALRRYDMVVDHVTTLAEATEAMNLNVHGAVRTASCLTATA